MNKEQKNAATDLTGAAHEIDSVMEGIPSIYDHDRLFQRKTFLGTVEFEELSFSFFDIKAALNALRDALAAKQKAEAEREQLREALTNLVHRCSMLCLSERTPQYLSSYACVKITMLEELRKASGQAQEALATPHAAAVNLYDNAKYRCQFCGRGFDREAALITHGDECKPAAPATPTGPSTPLDMFGRTQDEADDDNWAEPSDMGAQ